MPRVRIGPAESDRKTLDVEIARLRDLDVGALRNRWHTYSGGEHPLTCPAISCFVFWLTGFRPISWATWIVRVGGCSTPRGRPRKQDSVPWTCGGGPPN